MPKSKSTPGRTLRDIFFGRAASVTGKASSPAKPGGAKRAGPTGELSSKVDQAKSSIAQLTKLEQDILRYMVEGYSAGQIAELTQTSQEQQLESRHELLEKLGAESNSAAIRIGIYAFSVFGK